MKKIINTQKRIIVKQNTMIVKLINENIELERAFRELIKNLVE